jgi:hypothetical protein
VTAFRVCSGGNLLNFWQLELILVGACSTTHEKSTPVPALHFTHM